MRGQHISERWWRRRAEVCILATGQGVAMADYWWFRLTDTKHVARLKAAKARTPGMRGQHISERWWRRRAEVCILATGQGVAMADYWWFRLTDTKHVARLKAAQS